MLHTPWRSIIFWLAVIEVAVTMIVAAALIWGALFLAMFFTLLSLAVATFLVTTAFSVLFGAPFVPTDERNVAEMLRLAGLKPGERLLDLGSGDGRILIAAAKAGASAEGWEVNPFLWAISRWKIRRAGVSDRATARLGSYWSENVGQADVVTLFLITQQMRKMQDKLRRELRPGSRVVSYIFKFPDWPARESNNRGVRLYLQT